MNFILNLAFAIGITIALGKIPFLQNADAKAKSKVKTGCWCGFAFSALSILVRELALMADDDEFLPYVGYLISDFAGIANGVVLIGAVMIAVAIVSEKLNNKFNLITTNDDEAVLLSAESMISDKLNGVCKKIYKFGSIAIVAICLYEALSYTVYRLGNLGMYFNFDDIYYAISYIPYSIGNALFCIAGLTVLITLCCLFVKNSLVVTDKRVYGRGNFCKSINIEYDAITGVEAKGKSNLVINVGLKNISLLAIANRDEIVNLIKPNIKPQEVKQQEVKPQAEEVIENREEEVPMFTVNPLLKQASCKVSKVIILSVVTLGIYYFVWLYKMTKALNLVDDNEQRDPVKTILLCLFVPLFVVWWFYKSAAAIKKLEVSAGIKSDIGILCPIFGMLMPFISVAIIQDSLNKIVE